jgi:hypothetical protein
MKVPLNRVLSLVTLTLAAQLHWATPSEIETITKPRLRKPRQRSL